MASWLKLFVLVPFRSSALALTRLTSGCAPTVAMALKSKTLPVLVLAALCFFALRALAFVAPPGGMAARAGTGALAAGVAPSTSEGGLVAMQARGGAEGLEVEDPQLYIVVMCVLFGASVLANSNGFFGPW